MRLRIAHFLLCGLCLGARISAAPPSEAGIQFFETRIRPLLAEHCFSCHGEEKQKSKLRLDSPGAIRQGGEQGAILVPGDPAKSRLIVAVSYEDPDLQMPPKQRLAPRQISDLIQWVRIGAPMPTNQLPFARETKTGFEVTEADRGHWAFQPVPRPLPPPGGDPIDAFVIARLKDRGLVPNPIASPRELIRRVYFDLIGVPPTPEELAAWEKNYRAGTYEKLIDHLLARPQYGERWGRHWLDLVRFAQSEGYERDGEKPLAWRYRDYVIRAFNEDKPYDQFIREQIAGDEIPDATADSVVATGFQRLGVFDDEPDDKRQAEFDALDDVLATASTAFLGLTLACARCHDHKFDPLSQRDYYGMLAFFRGVRPYQNSRNSFDAPGFAPLAPPQTVKQWLAGRQEKLKPLQAALKTTPDPAEKKRLEQEIKKIDDSAPFEWTLAVREAGPTPPATHLLVRGNPATPGAEVAPAYPVVLERNAPQLTVPPADALSSGRRLALAQWIANDRNPLTARVMVNRIWQKHFGMGLVKTTADFGRAGARPSHPQLLDWLASELVASGWSIKHLHRIILRSQTYRQSSRADNAAAVALDPGNELLWRQNLRRLEAEAVRDSLLTMAGTMNWRMGGRGFFPHLSGEVLAGQSRPGLDWEVSTPAETSRRSVYAFIRRTMPVPLFESFDYNNTTTPVTERTVTTVAPQALMLLNDHFVQEQATAFAHRLEQEAGGNPTRQIARGYQIAVARDPTRGEAALAEAFLQRQTAAFSTRASSLTFRADVAGALAIDYFAKLQPRQFLLGPAEGWTYYRGSWAPAYEGIRVVDRNSTPFALWDGAPTQDGTVSAEILLSNSAELAALLLRAQAEADHFRGYEILLDVRRHRTLVNRCGPVRETIAEVETTFAVGNPIAIKVNLRGDRIRVWLGASAQPVADLVDAKPLLHAGRFGVRTWGGATTLRNVIVTAATDRGDQAIAVAPAPQQAAQQALASFCRLLMNLNEVLYID